MAIDCPVCHGSVSHWRVIRTTIFGSWHCKECDSVLAVDRKRRLLAIIPWTAIVIVLIIFLNILSYGMHIALPILVGLGLLNFIVFDNVVVVEQAGFHCKKCGYDLQGQEKPICPECGHQLEADQATVLGRIREGGIVDASQIKKNIRRRWKKAGVVFVAFAVVVVGLQFGGIYLLKRNRAAMSFAPETRLLISSVMSYVQNHNGTEPRHGLEHAREDVLTTDIFVLSDSQTNLEKIIIGGIALSEFDRLTEAEQLQVIETAAAELPENVIAHRVGDFVFAYHGIDLPTPGPSNVEHGWLWVVIGIPDPDQNPPPLPYIRRQMRIQIGLADGSVMWVSGFMASLPHQNKLRAENGLPPIPDPWTITHDQPAVSGGGQGDAAEEDG